jgi:peroxiredoxin
MLDIGDSVPRLSAMTTQEKQVDLPDFLGQYLVIYFFPKAFTPGCMVETKRFRDNYPDLKALGAEVLGVSMDDHATQCRFASETQAGFPMVADKDGTITEAFGVKWALLPVAKRVTFIIDPAGKVAARFHHELQVLKHLDKVLSFIQEAVRTPSGGH